MKYKKAILGGTFDRLHVGHRRLLDTAFEQSEYVTIGITTEKLYQHKFLAGTIETYSAREQSIKNYLVEKNYLTRATLIPIDSLYGTTLDEKEIEAIFVTEENLPNVKKINAKRKEISFPQLEVIVVPYVDSIDGMRVTSERIRGGEIDRTGYVYQQIFAYQEELLLPKSLRDELRKPLGAIVKDVNEILTQIENRMSITVGDIVTQSLIVAGHKPDIRVIDLKTRRHTIQEDTYKDFDGVKTINKAGTINSKAVIVYDTCVKAYLLTGVKQTMIIEGEEDLLALPAILLAPLESIVLYGQYDQGIVVNYVTEEKKKIILELLKKFGK